MKNIFLFLAVVFCLSSCGKEFNGLSVDEYIAENNLVTMELDEGVHIIIHEPGDLNKPNINSIVQVSYEGRLTNGDEFDSSNNIEFPLGNLVRGWQIGLKEIGIGGQCTLIIPPSAGYGSEGKGSVPGNAVMIFDMELKDIII